MKPIHQHPFNWLDSLHLTDPAFVEESTPATSNPAVIRSIRKRTRLRRAVALIAATLALCMLGGIIALCIPYSTTPPDVSRYKDSEYYAVIQSINTLKFQPPRYKNGLESLFSSMNKAMEEGFDYMNGSTAGDAAPPTSAPPASGTPGYTEVTDNQVAGVIEADLFKRSNTHIFYLYGELLYVYSIEGEDSRQVAVYEVPYFDPEQKYSPAINGFPEIYLSTDGRTLTILYEYDLHIKNGRANAYVGVLSLDVSDPTAITVKGRISLSGDCVSSRMVDGSLLLVSEFLVDGYDFDDESTFVPQIDTGDGFESLPIEDIEVPDGATHTRYTVVTKLAEGDLTLIGSKAFYSYTNDVYVTPTHIYLSRVYFDYSEPIETTLTYTYRERNSMTEIRCLDHTGDTVAQTGSVTVRGYIENQYSLDEHEGILRVVTTTNATNVRDEDGANRYGVVNSDMQSATGGISNASLYCIDTATWAIVAEVIDFAPPGEEVRSVRFDGDMAYVCTAIEVTDPVFFIDLSNLEHITVKDTGTITGFSHSLVNFKDGFLLGIGQGSWTQQFKIEMYEETPDGVRAVDAYIIEPGYGTDNYKAYFIDRERGLIGFGIESNPYDYKNPNPDTPQGDRYILLQFNGYRFTELANIPLDGLPAHKRATLIDGYFYMFSANHFKVIPLNIN